MEEIRKTGPDRKAKNYVYVSKSRALLFSKDYRSDFGKLVQIGHYYTRRSGTKMSIKECYTWLSTA